MDYRHGPISIAQPGRAVWIFGKSPAGLEKNIADSGALLVTSELDPMVHLVLAQRVAVAISEGRGLDTDNPRGLARSIVLN
jgi:fructoselysine-6-P-deglycase FrlB-like protein